MTWNSGARPLRGTAELHRVLSLVLDQVDPGASGVNYRLVGTAAALAQGVQLPVGDIDILAARRSDVDTFAAALSTFPCLVPPAWLPNAGQYFTRFEIAEINVEVSTVEIPTDVDTSEGIGTGPWQHYTNIEVGKHVIPVVRLELRLVSELVRNRADRYTPLVEHMRSHGADRELVEKAMHDRSVDQSLQRTILDRLGWL